LPHSLVKLFKTIPGAICEGQPIGSQVDPTLASIATTAAQRWTFPWFTYDDIDRLLKQSVMKTREYFLRLGSVNDLQNQALDVEPLPKFVVDIISEYAARNGIASKTGPPPPTVAAQQAAQIAHFKTNIPADLLSALFPFQRQGLEFALSRGGRVLIGDEMVPSFSDPLPSPPLPSLLFSSLLLSIYPFVSFLLSLHCLFP